MSDSLNFIWDSIPLSASSASLYIFIYAFVGAFLCILAWVLVTQKTPVEGYSLRPRPIAWFFSLWITATVLWGGYFGAFRIPGLFDLTLERFFLICTLGTAIFMVGKHRVSFAMSKAADILMILFLFACLVSMGIHGFLPAFRTFAKPWFLFITGYLFPFVGFLLAKYFLDPDRDYPLFFRVLFFLGAYISIIAIFENYKLNSLIFPRYISDPTVLLHLERARGPFQNAAINGVLLGVSFIAGFAMIPLNRGYMKYLYTMLLFLFFPAIYFTRTRSVYLLFLVILGGILIGFKATGQKWKLLGIPLVMVAFLAAMNADRLTSTDRLSGGLYQVEEIDIRFQLMNKSLYIFGNNPIFGIGLAQFRAASLFATSQAEFQHNHIMGIAAELGLIGLLLYLGFIGVILYRVIKLTFAVPEGQFINTNLVLLLALAVLANLISNTFLEPSLHLFTDLNMFVFAGMIDRLYNRYVLKTDVPESFATQA